MIAQCAALKQLDGRYVNPNGDDVFPDSSEDSDEENPDPQSEEKVGNAEKGDNDALLEASGTTASRVASVTDRKDSPLDHQEEDSAKAASNVPAKAQKKKATSKRGISGRLSAARRGRAASARSDSQPKGLDQAAAALADQAPAERRLPPMEGSSTASSTTGHVGAYVSHAALRMDMTMRSPSRCSLISRLGPVPRSHPGSTGTQEWDHSTVVGAPSTGKPCPCSIFRYTHSPEFLSAHKPQQSRVQGFQIFIGGPLTLLYACTCSSRRSTKVAKSTLRLFVCNHSSIGVL